MLVVKQARASIPDLGRSMVVDNARTPQTLGIQFRPYTQSAALAESLLVLGLAWPRNPSTAPADAHKQLRFA